MEELQVDTENSLTLYFTREIRESVVLQHYNL
jgi:hypothetical protein